MRISPRRLLSNVLFAVTVVWVSAGIPQPIHAQTNDASALLPANRFLLIVETSRAMQRRSAGTLRTVSDLIASRMRGQLHLNDTLGVWTFNETLYTGKLPLQEWSEGGRSEIAGKILDFLKEQKYEKQAQLDKVLPAVMQVVKNSEFITVILISEGSQDFHGTPFDQQINQSYKQWNAQQQQARMPFVTVLRARRGRFTNYSVTPAPFSVEMPPLPVELVKPKAPPSLPVASAPKPPPMAPPLIISGKKPEPAPVVVSTTNSPVATPNAVAVTTSAPLTRLAQPKPPDTAAQTSAPAPPTNQRIVAAPSPNTVAATPAPPATPAPTANVEPKSLAKLSAESLPTAPPPVTQPIETKTIPEVSSNLSTTQPDQPPLTKDAHAAPSPEVAVSQAAGSYAKFVVLGLLLAAAAALAGVWFWKRRTRPPAHVSLITRSLDREDH